MAELHESAVPEQSFIFESSVWRYDSTKSSWFFATLPLETAEQIRFFFPLRRGFGSIPVQVQIGASQWKTSIFPDKKSGSFVLPLKSQIRQAERINEAQVIKIQITVRP